MLNRDRHDPLESDGREPLAPYAALEDLGDVHYAAAGFGTALEYYDDVLRHLGSDLEFDPQVAARLNRKLADCYRSKGMLDPALDHLERACLLLSGHESELEFGIVLGRRADVECAQGKQEVALADARAALDILGGTSAHRDYAFVLRVAAAIHGRSGQFADFEQLNLDALATYRRINDQEGVAAIFNNLGIAYKNACQWDKAIRSLTEAKEISLRLGLTRRIARNLGNLGIVYTKTRDFHEAIAHLRRARRMAISLGDQATIVSVQNSLGHAYLLCGKLAQAQRCLLEARVLAERHQMERSVALADEFLGDLMLAQGHFAEARQNYESGLKRARGFAPKGDVVGEILRRMADLELAIGLRSRAIATARRALKVCEGCNELHEIGFIHRTMGLSLQGLGKPREAAVALAASITAFERTRNPYELAWSRTQLAELHILQGDREGLLRAARESEAALTAFRAIEDDRGSCAAGLLLARAHRGLGNYDDGLLAIYDLERICDENPNLECGHEVRALRRELEGALVSRGSESEVSSLNLFSELYSLAHAGDAFDARLQDVLGSLCARAQCSAAFIALCSPAAVEPQVAVAQGLVPNEAARLARFLVRSGAQPLMLGHAEGPLAHAVPEVARRSAAILCQPLCLGERTLGILYLERGRDAGVFTQQDVDFIATYANLAAVMVYENRREMFETPEVPPGRETLDPVMDRILTSDPAMFRILALAQKVARSDCTVLLAGETGTGKGLLAHCIHQMSDRRGRKFIALNCAALPEQLLESELFGHVRGAFTGAEAEKIGLLEAAHGGTVFLDEVGKTSLFMQGKLLQFLDSSEVRPVGSNEFRRVDVRVVCASKSSLRDLVAEGRLLEDLYYRLNDFPIMLPPLRERRGDIRLLMEHALSRAATELRKPVPVVSRAAALALEAHAWPGNVRELEKCIKRAVILADEGQPITLRHLPDELQTPEARADEGVSEVSISLRESVALTEARVIRAALQRSAGNKSEAARLLGVSYPCLLQKIRTYAAILDGSLGPA